MPLCEYDDICYLIVFEAHLFHPRLALQASVALDSVQQGVRDLLIDTSDRRAPRKMFRKYIRRSKTIAYMPGQLAQAAILCTSSIETSFLPLVTNIDASKDGWWDANHLIVWFFVLFPWWMELWSHQTTNLSSAYICAHPGS